MHRYRSSESGTPSDDLPPSEAWLFAQAILGKPIPRIVSPEKRARAKREELQRLSQFSARHSDALRKFEADIAEARHDREVLEFAAQISTRAEEKLRILRQKEAAEREAWRRAELFAERLLEGRWDPSQHPRAPKGQPDGGRWISKGGAGSAGDATMPSGPFGTASFHGKQAPAQFASVSGSSTATWPATGPTSPWLPKVGSGAAAGAGTAAGIGAGAFLGGLRNASMGAYWSRVPGTQAMPQIWVYNLEKRVRAGTLSREDAIGIFNTAVLGAQAQALKPTGGTMSAVHKSAVDFLGKAEQVYFAKKQRETEWAKRPGGYQQSEGRVFPTEHNSGLRGKDLRQEQERFFERGLAEGKEDWYLRGQASNAGLIRRGTAGKPDDHMEDPEVEAALQRAINNSRK